MIRPPSPRWCGRLLGVTSERSVRRGTARRKRSAPAARPSLVVTRSADRGPSARSRGMIRASLASASAVTSSPPTTSDSLLASARSIPSVSATIVGPRPAAPTIAFRTRSAPDFVDQGADPSSPGAPAVPGAAGMLGRVRVGEGDHGGAVLRAPARALAPSWSQRRGRDAEIVTGGDHLERLGPDRASRSEYQHALHGRPV